MKFNRVLKGLMIDGEEIVWSIFGYDVRGLLEFAIEKLELQKLNFMSEKESKIG